MYIKLSTFLRREMRAFYSFVFDFSAQANLLVAFWVISDSAYSPQSTFNPRS